MINNTSTSNLIGYCSLQFNICARVQLDTRKQVINQTEEEGLILIHLKHRERGLLCRVLPKCSMIVNMFYFLSYQLGEIHVTEHSHDNTRLCVIGSRSFAGPKRPQHRQDVPQAKVIVDLPSSTVWVSACHQPVRLTMENQFKQSDLFRQLFFTQFIEDKKFLGKDDVFVESTAGQLDPHDDLSKKIEGT